jgi:CBS domain containing-hemolysin-like protein
VLDEHDRRRAGIVRVDDTVIFPGELRPDEVRDRTGIRIPEGDVYDTVGGYIMSVLERIPAVGDTVEIEDGTLEVQRMAGRRVERVRFVPTPMPHAAATTEGGERR